jgi:hypothetical protein
LDFEEYKPKTFELAPAVGFEPTTNRLTADRSTTELRWIFALAVAERICCLRDLWRQVLPLRTKIAAETAAAQQNRSLRKIGCGGGI